MGKKRNNILPTSMLYRNTVLIFATFYFIFLSPFFSWDPQRKKKRKRKKRETPPPDHTENGTLSRCEGKGGQTSRRIV
jgi:hypothetical protein